MGLWKKRFFVLERGTLEYYESDEGSSALGKVLLANASQVPTKSARDVSKKVNAQASEAWRLNTDCKQPGAKQEKMHEK